MLLTFLFAAIPSVIAITLHEAAHGYAAWSLGDDTAKRMGRLSLNPLAHVDRFGTIILPGLLLVGQLATVGHVSYMFGWAKPVPVDAERFANPRRGMALVAVAGPAMNFLLAWLGALSLWLLPYVSLANAETAFEIVQLFMVVNLALGLFNLIPIPPLDGGRIAVGILPARLAFAWARLERFGLPLMILMIFVVPSALSGLGIRFDPVRNGIYAALPRALEFTHWLAGAPLRD